MLKRLDKALAFLCLVLTLTACANFSAVDKPISKVTPHGTGQIVSQRSNDLLVLVGFSGGGTRAAAFAYGVLKTLADTEVVVSKGRIVPIPAALTPGLAASLDSKSSKKACQSSRSGYFASNNARRAVNICCGSRCRS